MFMYENIFYLIIWVTKNTPHPEMKWKIWTLFNNWFSVINNLKIFYKESQTQYFTKFALFFFFFSFICTKEWSDTDESPERRSDIFHTHKHSLTHRKTKQTKKNILTSFLKLFNSAVFLSFFKLHWFHLVFFSKCFFHTLVKHGHRAPDYRLQIHIRTSLSHRDAPTQMQRGSGGGFKTHPYLF